MGGSSEDNQHKVLLGRDLAINVTKKDEWNSSQQ